MMIKKYSKKDIDDLKGTTKYFDEYLEDNGQNFYLSTPEYKIGINDIDPVIGQELEDIHWNADSDEEMLTLHFNNSKELNIYISLEGKICIESD